MILVTHTIQDFLRVLTIVLLTTLRTLMIQKNLKAQQTDVHSILVILGTQFCQKAQITESLTIQESLTILTDLRTSIIESLSTQRIHSHTILLFLKDLETESLMIQETHGIQCSQKVHKIASLMILDIHMTHQGLRIS